MTVEREDAIFALGSVLGLIAGALLGIAGAAIDWEDIPAREFEACVNRINDKGGTIEKVRVRPGELVCVTTATDGMPGPVYHYKW